MAASFPDWPRPYFRQGQGKPFLCFVVYGSFDDVSELSAAQYRSAGLPPGFDLFRYNSREHPDVLTRFQEGYLWDTLRGDNLGLATRIAGSAECIILRGEIDDSPTLNYLRDSVGLLTYFLDNGGVTVFDPHMFQWWEPDEWRERVFTPAAPVPRRHVVILTSEEAMPHMTWFHTRGLRKFGRPDLSIHNVQPRHEEAIIELFERFIEYQALGGVIDENQEISMDRLPGGMTCHQRGDLDDPDFNNRHVEIVWPHDQVSDR
jgi:hypothetical protein